MSKHGFSDDGMFQCHICEKCWDGKNAKMQAYQHTRNTGHTTSGEQIKIYTFEKEKMYLGWTKHDRINKK